MVRRCFASAKSRVEGEALRQLYAAAKLDRVRLAVGFPDLQPGKGGPVGAAFVVEGISGAIGNEVYVNSEHGRVVRSRPRPPPRATPCRRRAQENLEPRSRAA